MPDVIMTVGAPGSGKTTFARSLDPLSWLTLSLDDFRAGLWGSKKLYHEIVNTDADPTSPHPMRKALHRVYRSAVYGALSEGLNVCLANTHIYPTSFEDEMILLEVLGVTPRLRVFLTPLDELLRRNETRPPEDKCDPAYVARCFADLHSPGAWWRQWRGPIDFVDGNPEDFSHAA